VHVERLADALIAGTSGQTSVGQVYRFLCQHYNATVAREEFVRFLRGDRPELLLRSARSVTARMRTSSQGFRMSIFGNIRMASWTRISLSALIIGTTASIVSTAALAILATLEGKGALQPTNATSHWLHGESAAAFAHMDTRHTGLGYATHHASALFWAWPFAAWLASRPDRSSVQMLRDASVLSAIAATVDYGITPKRLTPGWELVLPTRSMFAAFAALAIGLALGARVTQDLLGTR
jgi:hypothetical protein